MKNVIIIRLLIFRFINQGELRSEKNYMGSPKPFLVACAKIL